ncbi:MAG: hypothetical protein ACLQIK_25965 [Mycobacterium sp.]|uniref:hypothetical protein n=1 Tax=Mycobacterium sp. TaxID=1785 RepID=UPI003F99A934
MSDVRTAPQRRRTPRGAGNLGKSLRSTPGRLLIGAALAVPLVLGGAFLSVGRLHSTPSDVLDHPASPVTDEQSKDQVVGPARQIVSAAGLQTASAGYLLMSCKNRDDPPYQGAVYLTFALPAGQQTDTYFETVASTLRTHGWVEGPPPNNHAFAKIFSQNAVTVTIYRDNDDPGAGVLRLYGECRNMNDHGHDATGWADITGEVATPR